MIEAVRDLMEHETAGDPITGLKWTRKTLRKLSEELAHIGLYICGNTVGRLLKAMGFSLRVNSKKISSGSCADRNAQFEFIGEQRRRFASLGLPAVSVDAKKREQVGLFKNNGVSWEWEAVLVNDHDYPSLGSGSAVPYGVYDINENLGFVFVGASYDTSEFAVDSIARWWSLDGRQRYSEAKELLILADGGGSNGWRRRLWKSSLQTKLCDRFGISVIVRHYPTGASKWNPIEHRLFSEISKNWSGVPLKDYETILNYISATSTASGLKVRSELVGKVYEKGIKISDEQMKEINLIAHEILPKWNYTIKPSVTLN